MYANPHVLKAVLEGKSVRTSISGAVPLDEKLIIIGKGARYGQVVFMAGGGASGKGFVVDSFMEGDKFKVRDVDAWKVMFQRLERYKLDFFKNRDRVGLDQWSKKTSMDLMKVRRINEPGDTRVISDLDLKNSKDVFKLHDYIRGLKIKEKTLDLLLTDLEAGRFPNLLFDITASDKGDIDKVAAGLVSLGYDPKNINIVWALTSFDVAKVRNQERSRVVPPEILLKAHTGTAREMSEFLFKNTLDRSLVDGEMFIVLNNTEETKLWPASASALAQAAAKGLSPDKAYRAVQGFTYTKVKKVGKPVEFGPEQEATVRMWIDQNTPREDLATESKSLRKRRLVNEFMGGRYDGFPGLDDDELEPARPANRFSGSRFRSPDTDSGVRSVVREMFRTQTIHFPMGLDAVVANADPYDAITYSVRKKPIATEMVANWKTRIKEVGDNVPEFIEALLDFKAGRL